MQRTAKDYIFIALKGFAMGAANVIPGVSGGTIALVAGIYEELINSLKSFNLKALKLLLGFKFKELFKHINFSFLVAVFGGTLVSIFTIAKVFKYLFDEHPILIWAFFFGLIIASVYYVGKTISKWNAQSILSFVIGLAIALILAFLNPSTTQNENLFYIVLCGVIGISGMLLPGLSGSFILILMGNYLLLMVDSINYLSEFIKMALSGDLSEALANKEMMNHLVYFGLFAVGSLIGLFAFSHVIAVLLKKYKDITIALLTGFILGSLYIIWPWKNDVYLEINGLLQLDRHGEPIISSYEKYFPAEWGGYNLSAIGLMVLGIVVLWAIEYYGSKIEKAK